MIRFLLFPIHDLIRTNMQETEPVAILKDSVFPFKENYIYKSNGVLFVFNKLFKKAKINVVQGSQRTRYGCFMLDITSNNKKQDAFIYISTGYAPDFQEINIDGIPFKMALWL